MLVVFLLHIFRPSSSIDAVIMLVYGYLTTAAGLKCVILDWFGRFYATHLLFICCRFILSMNNGWFHVLFQIKVVCATWNVQTQPFWFANIACPKISLILHWFSTFYAMHLLFKLESHETYTECMCPSVMVVLFITGSHIHSACVFQHLQPLHFSVVYSFCHSVYESGPVEHFHD